jgi:hypothetical protein
VSLRNRAISSLTTCLHEVTGLANQTWLDACLSVQSTIVIHVSLPSNVNRAIQRLVAACAPLKWWSNARQAGPDAPIAHAHAMATLRPDAPLHSTMQRQVKYREVLEPLFIKQTRLLHHDQTRHRVRSVLLLYAPSFTPDVSVRHLWPNSGPARLVNFILQCLVMPQRQTESATSWLNAQVSSEPTSSHLQWPLFTYFSTLAQMC